MSRLWVAGAKTKAASVRSMEEPLIMRSQEPGAVTLAGTTRGPVKAMVMVSPPMPGVWSAEFTDQLGWEPSLVVTGCQVSST